MATWGPPRVPVWHLSVAVDSQTMTIQILLELWADSRQECFSEFVIYGFCGADVSRTDRLSHGTVPPSHPIGKRHGEISLSCHNRGNAMRSRSMDRNP